MDKDPVAVCEADVAAAFAEAASQRSSVSPISSSGRFAVHNTALSLQSLPPLTPPAPPHPSAAAFGSLSCACRYADIYFCRLNKLKPAVSAAAAAKWPHACIRCARLAALFNCKNISPLLTLRPHF